MCFHVTWHCFIFTGLRKPIFNFVALIAVSWCRFYCCHSGGTLFASGTWICFFTQVWRLFRCKFIRYVLMTFPSVFSFLDTAIMPVLVFLMQSNISQIIPIFNLFFPFLTESFPAFCISVSLCIILYHLGCY